MIVSMLRAVRLAASSADYPDQLRHIPDPPAALHCLGDVGALSEDCVAIVGSRRCSLDGRDLAGQFAERLAAAGVTIVSGLALGIDTAAHEGALAAGGRSVAVLGGGLDRIYPARNQPLALRLAARGAVISEYAPGTPPARHRFPERNRIISGLCRAVLVVEASQRSGSLITARMALEQGRDVLAVPGPLRSPTSAGCHRLLREGAALIDSVESLFFELGLDQDLTCRSASDEAALSTPGTSVLAAFEGAECSADELAARTGLPVPAVLAALAELELAGFVSLSAAGYSRRPLS